MARTIAPFLTALLLTLALAPLAGGTARTESRSFVAGVGASWSSPSSAAPRLCPSFLTASEVCFVFDPSDVAVTVTVDHSVSTVPIAASAYFEDAAGLPAGSLQTFCGVSPTLARPAGAQLVRVIVGPLSNASAPLACPGGVASMGIVHARFD